MSVINTNISALNAQRNLTTSQSTLATSLQRLSSGLRINSAKDDAAGLSIASRMSAQIGGLNQAVRNANDAISMSQTAEGAMSEVSNMLTRLRDLAVQAANGTNSTLDRATIQNEVDQLTNEIDRVSNSTEFNGNKLLNGKANNLNFQVGANSGQTIAFSISEVSVKSLALNASSALGELNSGRVTTTAPNVTSATTSDLVINGVSITLAATDTSATLKATAINNSTGQTGVAATAYNSLQGSSGASGLTTGALTIAVGGGSAITVRASANMQDLVDKINSDVGGVTASIGTNGGLSLTNETGASITVGGTVTGTGLTAGTYQGYLALHSNTGQPISISTLGVSSSNLNKSGFNATSSDGNVSSFGFLGAAAANDSAAVALLNAGAAQPKLLTTDDVKINGVSLGATGSSAAEKAFAINAISEKTGVTATANNTAYIDLANLGTATTFTINGSTVTLAATDTDTAKVVTAIQNAGISGISASTDSTTGRLVLSSSGGNDIVIGQTTGTTVARVSDTATGTGTALAANQSIGMRGTITLKGNAGTTVRVDGSSTSVAKLGLSTQGGNPEAVGGKLNVSTASNASIAITRIDSAIQYIATQRSTMGAIQNRFNSAISNLSTSAENITAARSRIRDADFAAETANLTRAQILQQAGTAMLAQANSLPNGVLALLRG